MTKATAFWAAADGWVVMLNRLGAPAEMVMVPEVTLMRLVAVKERVRSPDVPVIIRLMNGATPEALVVIVTVPPRVPPPEAIAAETSTPAELTALSEASRS